MTSKPDSVSTLGNHWTDRTGRPLEPQVHWDATGTTLADASTLWCSSGDPVLICIIGTHWKTTGATSTLGCHWNYTGWCLHPVVSQWRSSVNLHNWNTLEDRWKATGSTLAFLQWHSSVHWGLSSRHTGLTLEDHWLRVRVEPYFINSGLIHMSSSKCSFCSITRYYDQLRKIYERYITSHQ